MNYNDAIELVNHFRENIGDYEQMKKRLFLRAVNEERNYEDLQDAIYHLHGEIALTVYFNIGDFEELSFSAKVKRWNLAMWDRMEAEVFECALNNTMNISPARIISWEKFLTDANWKPEGEDLFTEWEVPDKGPQGNCLTTLSKTNGAVSIFLPGVAEKLSEKFDSDLYLAFTSVHEVMVHSADTVDPEDIQEVLRQTIEECAEEEDFLTDKVYYYSRETKKITEYRKPVVYLYCNKSN